MRRVGLLSALAGLLILLVSPLAYADAPNYVITDFTSDQTLSNTDPQGTLHIVEQISVQFSSPGRGIVRTMPDDYNSKPLNLHVNTVTSTTGAPVDIVQATQDDNMVLKIGSAGQAVSGTQEYTIDYTVQNVISFYTDHDELYWDVNTDLSSPPITNITVHLHVPASLPLGATPQCFIGEYDATGQKCTITQVADGITASTTNVASGQTLTYVTDFAKGYFKPEATTKPIVVKKDPKNTSVLPAIIILAVVVVAGGCIWWRKYRRS